MLTLDNKRTMWMLKHINLHLAMLFFQHILSIFAQQHFVIVNIITIVTTLFTTSFSETVRLSNCLKKEKEKKKRSSFIHTYSIIIHSSIFIQQYLLLINSNPHRSNYALFFFFFFFFSFSILYFFIGKMHTLHHLLRN